MSSDGTLNDLDVRQELEAFAELVDRFCRLYESLSEGSREFDSGSQSEIVSLLARLYADAARLRYVSREVLDPDEELAKSPTLSESGPEQTIAGYLAGTYWALEDPYDPKSLQEQNLLDDLQEIYFDLERGRSTRRKGAPLSEAGWHWRFRFDVHWGDHAVNALKAMHHYLRRH